MVLLGRSLLVTFALAAAITLGGCNATSSSDSSTQATAESPAASTSQTSAASSGATSSSPATASAAVSSDVLANASPAANSAVTGAPGVNPLGINLAAVAYYSPEQPFLNIVKAGGSSSAIGNINGWYTSTSGSWDTQEEAICSWIRMAIRLPLPPLPRSRRTAIHPR